jgi:hypothetical protein
MYQRLLILRSLQKLPGILLDPSINRLVTYALLYKNMKIIVAILLSSFLLSAYSQEEANLTQCSKNIS